MRVFLTGGTGFVGRRLVEALREQGHSVTVVTRSVPSEPAEEGLTYVQGDPTRQGAWQETVPAHDVAINLAGASIFRRWTRRNKAEIRRSRIDTTRNLVRALSARRDREALLVSASGTGYYGHREEEGLDEDATPGSDFLATLSQEWEAEAAKAAEQGVRVVLCRLGVVLGRTGGALRKMLPAFRAGLGSPLGKGNQWFSWIHLEDLARIFLFLLEQPEITGPVNCTAPEPVRNRQFTEGLARALSRPTFLPAVPGPLLRLALGEFAKVLLEGQCAVPARLLRLGFVFRFPTLAEALQDLLQAPGSPSQHSRPKDTRMQDS